MEPVARAVAAPLLADAETARARHADDLMRVKAALAPIEIRLAELREEEGREEEDAWRAAYSVHRQTLQDRRDALLAERAAATDRLARLEEEAQSVRATLTRLSRRRALLTDLKTGETPSEPYEDSRKDSGEILRANLAALAASLAEGDRLARARLDAQREMDALEADLRA